ASTMSRAVRRPASCPAERERPCAVAHRPLPSMMMARCGPAKLACVVGPECRDVGISVSTLPSGANERLHVVQVSLERAPSGSGDAVFRPRYTALERLLAGHVAGILQLASVHAEVAVRRLHQTLELVEGKRLIDGERAHNAQPQPFVNQPIERQ